MENDTEIEDDNPTEEAITFLYELAPGPCPKSYGFHAAKLAGISDEVRIARFLLKRRYSTYQRWQHAKGPYFLESLFFASAPRFLLLMRKY